ncbi:MAG: hypothetical protein JWP81_5357 [Ferruginibacter sp.]|nr:hypothetical protein [Ferruginibacter sp.]
MKKIFTLVMAAGAISFASAQPGGSKGHFDNGNNDNKQMSAEYAHQPAIKNKTAGFENPSFSFREKEAQIQRINRDFDRQIAAVKKSRYLRGREKSQQIRILENQRSNEISQVQALFERSNHRDVDNGYAKNNSHKW